MECIFTVLVLNVIHCYHRDSGNEHYNVKVNSK